MMDAQHVQVLVVCDDAAERGRVRRWCDDHVAVVDGGPPAQALAALMSGAYQAVVWTPGTCSIDLPTWFFSLCLGGYQGVVLDTTPNGPSVEGVIRSAGRADVRALLV